MSPIALLLLLQASTALSGDRCYSTASTQLELNRCAGASLEVADSRLDAFVRSYQAGLASEQLELFRSAQLSWQQFRQSACEFETSRFRGGSAYAMVLAQCMASKAESRLSELKALANCQAGDMRCPSYVGLATPGHSFKPTPFASRLDSGTRP